jgi:hypothetical protein
MHIICFPPLSLSSFPPVFPFSHLPPTNHPPLLSPTTDDRHRFSILGSPSSSLSSDPCYNTTTTTTHQPSSHIHLSPTATTIITPLYLQPPPSELPPPTTTIIITSGHTFIFRSDLDLHHRGIITTNFCRHLSFILDRIFIYLSLILYVFI